MSTRKSIIAFICKFLNSLYQESGWAVVQAKQDFPVRPNKYMVVDLLTERQLGDQELWDYNEETITIAGLRECTINIQAIGEGSVETLSLLPMHLKRPSIVDNFSAINLAVNDTSDVQDLTNVMDNSRYLERASIDLTISFDRDVIDNPYWFDVVFVNGVLYKEDNNKDEKVNIDFNVEKIIIKETNNG